MTWGEIQIISLQKMFAKDSVITVTDLPTLLADDDCKVYLSGMPAVCNEAIERVKPYCMNEYKWDDDEGKYVKKTVGHVSNSTASNYEIELPPDACVLLPLYIASELYKDDDISMATTYRNEFEAGLQELNVNIENQESIKEVY